MDNLYMTSPKLKVVMIKKKTAAEGFKDLKVGDTFQLRVKVRYLGSTSYGTRACYFEISINDGDFYGTTHSFNTITKYLDCFELKYV